MFSFPPQKKKVLSMDPHLLACTKDMNLLIYIHWICFIVIIYSTFKTSIQNEETASITCDLVY